MNRYRIIENKTGKEIASAPDISSATRLCSDMKKYNPKYKETIPGSTPLSIKIMPEDLAETYFKRAQGLDKYGKLKLEHFLAQVYGICGDHIRSDSSTQRAIENLLEQYYK